jgi:hypothetical protein
MYRSPLLGSSGRGGGLALVVEIHYIKKFVIYNATTTLQVNHCEKSNTSDDAAFVCFLFYITVFYVDLFLCIYRPMILGDICFTHEPGEKNEQYFILYLIQMLACMPADMQAHLFA